MPRVPTAERCPPHRHASSAQHLDIMRRSPRADLQRPCRHGGSMRRYEHPQTARKVREQPFRSRSMPSSGRAWHRNARRTRHPGSAGRCGKRWPRATHVTDRLDRQAQRRHRASFPSTRICRRASTTTSRERALRVNAREPENHIAHSRTSSLYSGFRHHVPGSSDAVHSSPLQFRCRVVEKPLPVRARCPRCRTLRPAPAPASSPPRLCRECRRWSFQG